MTILKKKMNWTLPPNHNFYWKLLGIVLILLISLFVGTKFMQSHIHDEKWIKINESVKWSTEASDRGKSIKGKIRGRSMDFSTNKRNKNESSEEAKMLASLAHAKTLSEISKARQVLAVFYAQYDPEAGIEWLNSLDPAGNLTGLLAVFGSVTAQNHGNMWEKLAAQFDSDYRTAFIEGALGAIGQDDAYQAWEKTKQFMVFESDPQAFANRVMKWIINKNPEQAMEILDFNSPGDNAIMFFQSAVFRDQTAAVMALDKIIDQNTRSDCFMNYARSVPLDSLKAFGIAISNDSNDDGSKDKEIYAVADRLFPDDIEGAVELCKKINDLELRSELAKSIMDFSESKGKRARLHAEQLLAK